MELLFSADYIFLFIYSCNKKWSCYKWSIWIRKRIINILNSKNPDGCVKNPNARSRVNVLNSCHKEINIIN